MKKIIQFMILPGMLLMICHSTGNAQAKPEEITIRKIWSNEYHNAFTSLLYFKGNFYCSFRQGSDHAGGANGLVQIIRSKDGVDWKSVALLEKPGMN